MYSWQEKRYEQIRFKKMQNTVQHTHASTPSCLSHNF